MPGVTEAADPRPDKIRLERLRRRLKQEQVAEMAGLNQATISKAESGRVSDATYEAIARALGVDL